MSDKMVQRDPQEMKNFADKLTQYCSEVRSICNKFENDFGDAKPYMKDAISKKSLSKLENLVQELTVNLPQVEDTAEKLMEAAAPLENIDSLM